MIYAEKHLSLLSRMERDGLQLRFTGEFPEEILDQTCKKLKIWACKRSSARKKPRRSRGN